jgi:uncharacterized membrane protein YvbJ
MICPRCHNENKYDALTCDFCMAKLPMTEARKKEIEEKTKLAKKAKLNNSITKLIGLLMGLIVLVGVVVVMYLIRK